MKERIVIEDKEVSKVCEDCGEYGEGCIMKENCKNKNTLSQTECCFNFRFTPKFKIEKYPTTWEDLKELCKKINSKIVNENAMYESQIIIDTDKGYFGFYMLLGKIDIVFKSAYSTNHTVAKNRTIPQTWSFIKSLIGEE